MSVRSIIETIAAAQGTAYGLGKLADELEQEARWQAVPITVHPLRKPKPKQRPPRARVPDWPPVVRPIPEFERHSPNIDPIDPMEA